MQDALPMHRCAIRPRSCYTSRFGLSFYRVYAQSLSTASSPPLATSKQSRPPLTKSQGLAIADDQRNSISERAQDIIVDDLSATLEAHRARNRAAVIRRITVQSGYTTDPFKRPLLDGADTQDVDTANEQRKEASSPDGSLLLSAPNQSEDSSTVDGDARTLDESNATKVLKAPITRKKPHRYPFWPADSVQAQREDTSKRRHGFVRSVDPLEYEGCNIQVKPPWKVTGRGISEFSRPWLPYMEGNTGDNLERLSNEIRAFEAYMSLSAAEEAAAKVVIHDMTRMVQRLLPTSHLTLLGSRSTGLATTTSDFDFSLSLSPSEEEPTQRTNKALRVDAVRALRKLERHLRSSKHIDNTEVVIARVPLLSCRHRATGLNIQFQTMATFQAAQQYTAAYLAEMRSLRPLYILIRQFLEIRDLTTVFEGGLGSYTTFMMIVTALKHATGRFAADDLGGQLLHVLDFYASANLYRDGYSADPPRVFDKLSSSQSQSLIMAATSEPQLQGIGTLVTNRNKRKPYLLSLQDPANDTNDLGKNAYAIKHVQASFRHAHNSLVLLLKKEKNKKEDVEIYLKTMVSADYKKFEIDRRRIERYEDPITMHSVPQDDSDDSILHLLDRRLQNYRRAKEEGALGPELVRNVLTARIGSPAEVKVRAKFPRETEAWNLAAGNGHVPTEWKFTSGTVRKYTLGHTSAYNAEEKAFLFHSARYATSMTEDREVPVHRVDSGQERQSEMHDSDDEREKETAEPTPLPEVQRRRVVIRMHGSNKGRDPDSKIFGGRQLIRKVCPPPAIRKFRSPPPFRKYDVEFLSASQNHPC